MAIGVMVEEIWWLTKPPKDKSDKVFFADTSRELSCSREYLVLKECGQYDFGNYVHSRKVWLDRETFEIKVVKYCELKRVV